MGSIFFLEIQDGGIVHCIISIVLYPYIGNWQLPFDHRTGASEEEVGLPRIVDIYIHIYLFEKSIQASISPQHNHNAEIYVL